MPNSFFQFKEFRINQEHSGMKVTTDGCLFGAWVADIFSDSDSIRVLDIGTGTGLLTLILAQKLDAYFDAIDINNKAWMEANENFGFSPWKSRISSFNVRVQDYQSANQYDLIICNPPFFSNNQVGEKNDKNIAIHDATLPMDELIDSIKRLLLPAGNLAIMYPEREMKLFLEKARDKGLYSKTQLNVLNQLDGKIFRIFSLLSDSAEPSEDNTLVIRDGHAYTESFIMLLEDYYL